MKFRLLNKIYADLCGYFWLPCPICGKHFGGHEWKDNHEIWGRDGIGKGVCPDCGDKAREINESERVRSFD